MGSALGEKRVGLGRKRLHGVGAGSEAGGRILERDELYEGVGELGGIATLLPIHALPGRDDFLRLLGIVVDGRLGVRGRVVAEQLGTEKPGSTSIVRIPKGAISGVRDSIHPSMPNFAAAYAVQNIWPAMPAVEEIVSSRPGALLAHHRQDGASDIHRAEQQRLDLIADLFRAELLEEAGEEIPALLTRTSIRPNFATAASTAAWASWGRVTSSLIANRLSWSPTAAATFAPSRPVATTACPEARTALAMLTPRPGLRR